MKQNKTNGKKREDLTLEPLPSSSLFAEAQSSTSPVQSLAYAENGLEETIDELELQSDEETVEPEEKDELQLESPHEEVIDYPRDITLEYLKGLEKISLLTPEKEVELAKRIKEGERQVKALETKTNRLKAELSQYALSRKGNRRSYTLRQGNKLKGRNGKKPKLTPSEIKEKNLLYKRMLNRYQLAVFETQQAKNELIQACLLYTSDAADE